VEAASLSGPERCAEYWAMRPCRSLAGWLRIRATPLYSGPLASLPGQSLWRALALILSAGRVAPLTHAPARPFALHRGVAQDRRRCDHAILWRAPALYANFAFIGFSEVRPSRGSQKFDLNRAWDARGAPPDACLAAPLAPGLSRARGQPAILLRPPRRGDRP